MGQNKHATGDSRAAATKKFSLEFLRTSQWGKYTDILTLAHATVLN